jgi:adenine-specific DNA-methyltransferase
LWSRLRSRRLLDFKFRRQQPLGPYVVDFVCFERKVIVEADGGQHANDVEYDDMRTKYLESCGYRVLRYWNNDILMNLEGVLTRVAEELRSS